MAQAFVPYLVDNAWGRIIVISAPLASRPPAKMAPYAVGVEFTIDAQSIVRLVCRSHDPADRPPVQALLDVLREIQKETRR